MSSPTTSGPRLAVSESGVAKGRATRFDFVGATVTVTGGIAVITGGGGGGGGAFDWGLVTETVSSAQDWGVLP